MFKVLTVLSYRLGITWMNDRFFGKLNRIRNKKTKAKTFKSKLIVQVNKMYTSLSHISWRWQINQLILITSYHIIKYFLPNFNNSIKKVSCNNNWCKVLRSFSIQLSILIRHLIGNLCSAFLVHFPFGSQLWNF